MQSCLALVLFSVLFVAVAPVSIAQEKLDSIKCDKHEFCHNLFKSTNYKCLGVKGDTPDESATGEMYCFVSCGGKFCKLDQACKEDKCEQAL